MHGPSMEFQKLIFRKKTYLWNFFLWNFFRQLRCDHFLFTAGKVSGEKGAMKGTISIKNLKNSDFPTR